MNWDISTIACAELESVVQLCPYIWLRKHKLCGINVKCYWRKDESLFWIKVNRSHNIECLFTTYMNFIYFKLKYFVFLPDTDIDAWEIFSGSCSSEWNHFFATAVFYCCYYFYLLWNVAIFLIRLSALFLLFHKPPENISTTDLTILKEFFLL